MADEEYVSLRPSDAVHGGGMVPEGEYDIADAKFTMWDYAGTRPTSVPALGIEFKNADDQSFTQYYSAGDARNFAPSGDGKRLRKGGSATGLNDSSNCFMFVSSLVNAGFSEDKIGKDISVIIGTKVSVVHQATQERQIKGEKKGAGTIAVIGKIHAYPWDKPAAAPAKGKAKAAARAAAPNGNEATIRPKAVEILTTILKEAPNRQMDKKTVPGLVLKKIPATDTDRSDVLNMLIRDDFLNSLLNDGVVYDADGGTLLYAGD